ncbi:MAG: hypothetical protein WC155_06230 [Candidatus Cloacimonadales bacterium]|nr:hypothetical protein [Bacteroidales bacterium]MDD3962260.1 hypothetical protein [Bacteroidales bacterium]
MNVNIIDPKDIKIPKSTNDIDELIQNLKHVSQRNPDYDKLERTYYDAINIFPIFRIQVSTKELEEIPIFRTRPYKDIDENDIFNPSQFGAPPINEDCGIGRANWKCRNVFYGSDQIETSVAETKRYYEGEEFYISKWSFDQSGIEKYNHIDVRILTKTDIPKENILYNISQSFSEQVKQSFKLFSSSQQKIISYLNDRICELYLSDEDGVYPVTAFIADRQLYNANNTKEKIIFPILLYPSIENNFRSCNFAIHPLFVNNYMNLDALAHMKVVRLSNGKFNHQIVKVGKRISPSTVEWYHLNPNIDKATWLIQTVMCGVTERILYQFDGKDNEFEIEDLDESFPKMVNQYLFTNKNSIMESITIPDMDFKDALSLTHKFSLIGKDKNTEPIKCIRLIVTVLIQIPVEYSPIMN